MAEQQFPLSQEELNQEEFKPDVANILGYDKDMFNTKDSFGELPKINPQEQIQLFDDVPVGKEQKNALLNLNTISEESLENVSIDADGNYDFATKVDDGTGIMMNQEFEDPILEKKKKELIDDVNKRKDQEIETLKVDADQKVASGELKKSRRDRYIEKNQKEIEKRYKKEAEDGYKNIYKEANENKDKPLVKFKNRLNKYSEGINNLWGVVQKLQAGDVISQEDYISSYSDPEFQSKYLEVKGRGISSINQFKSEYEKGGNVKAGDIYLGYITGNEYLTTDAFKKSSRPVYFEATVDQQGNKTIKSVKPAFVHPVTKQVIGAYVPPQRGSSDVLINPAYTAIAGYSDQIAGIDKDVENGVIDVSEGQRRKDNAKSRRAEYLKKNIEAFDEIMASDKYSKDAKMAVIASTFPNEFKKKYTELLESGDKDIAGSILGWSIGLSAKVISTVTGAAASGIDNLVQAYLGLDDIEFPMGTLPLELKRNPEIALEMDNVVKSSYNRSSKYLTSIEGLAELTHAAKVNVNNKKIGAAIASAQPFVEELDSVVREINNDKQALDINIKNYSNDLLGIFNKKGYTTALNNAYKLNSELINSKDEDIRNAYRFIRLKQQVLNHDGSADQALSKLSKEDIEFINTVGKDLTQNRIPLLNTVVGKINEVADAFNSAKNLYPTKEVQEYERKNKVKLESDIKAFNDKVTLFTESDVMSSESSSALDIIQNLGMKYDQEAAGNELYTFPSLARIGHQMPKNLLAMTNPVAGLAVGMLEGVSDILRSVESTANLVGNIQSLDFDLQKTYISASLNEWKRNLEIKTPDTGNYIYGLSKQIGGALPQMAAFVASFVAGGPIGGASYLTATMTGDKMKEAANAGLDPIEQMLYTGLSIGIEYGSELVTSETGLAGVRGGKSLLTKELLKKIMNVQTRKEALKEYARLVWNTSKNVVKSGALESFEEQVSDKSNYILQNLFNNVFATTFQPSMMGLKESLDNLLTMTATGGIFKGTTAMFNRQVPVEAKMKTRLQEQGMSDNRATLVAGVSSPSGLKSSIDFVNAVESGQISSQDINTEEYEYLKNKLIPQAMRLQTEMFNMSANTNLSIQQRSVALFNMMQMNEVNDRVERGEISAQMGQAEIVQLQDNINKALKDKAFANEQFGLDDTGLAQKIKEYMGVADIAINEEGAMDARTTTPAATQEVAPATDVASSKPAMEARMVEAENDARAAASSATTAANPIANEQQADASVQAEMGMPAQAPSQVAGFEVVNKATLAERLINIVASPIRKNKARGSMEREINKNPEKALSMEIYNTRAQLDMAQDRYDNAISMKPAAPVELAEIKLITDRLNKLVALKDNYAKTIQYATEISQGLRQEIAQRRNLLQPTGTEQGQPQVGQREGGVWQTAQQAADARNRDFVSQAQAAVQEITAVTEKPPILNTYLSGMQPGQEVQLMDEIAAQVVTNEAAAVRQFGQPVVDRVKQYVADTNFTTDLPIVRNAMVRQAEQSVGQAEQEANTVIARQNQNTSKQHKKAVVKLVERLKQAFPNVKVFMDKKGFEAAIQDPAARELMTKGGVVYGRVLNGNVYLNPDFSNYNTPLHEFGHLWLNVAKEASPNIYNRGLELIRDSEYVTRLEGDPLYNGLTKEELEEEALATAIGDRGEQLVLESQKKGFRGWMTRLLRKMAQYVGIMNMSSSELRSLDLDAYLNMVNASLLAGEALTASKIEFNERFMAKMDNSVKNALTRVAQERFNLAIAKGMDLEAARAEAFTKLTEFVIGNYLNKSNYAEILDGLSGIVLNVSESERQRVIEQKKTEKLNQLFRFSEIQAIATMANEEALRLAQGKIKASDAITQVTEKVKAEIEALFAGNKAPAGVSWINAMALAPSIAADAVMAAFPATNRKSLVNEDIVIMTSSKYIRNAIFNQINAIKDVEKRAEAIKEAVKEIFKQMSDTYGKGLKLSPSKVNAIIAEIDANVFSREDIMSATDEAANAISNIIEKEYRKKLIDESVALLDKLKAKTAKAKYTGDMLNKAMTLLGINTTDWKNSDATLEDISLFNTAINKILAGDVSQFDFAMSKAGDIQVENNTKISSEFDSLMGKMNRMIAKAGNLDTSDYASIAALNNAMIDVKERKGDLSAFTAEQLAKLEQKYSDVIASIPGSLTIAKIVEQKEREITNDLKTKADLLASELISESSDIRMKIKNPLSLHKAMLFSSFILKGDYIDSLDTNGKLALINALDNIIIYGNYNYDAYVQDIKARKYYLKTNTIDAVMNMARRRRTTLASPGHTGLIFNKLKNFVRIFTDVEGTTPSAQLIADNFDLLRLQSMDVELFSGYDDFNMGFLERDIFAPMASGVDGAVNRTQAKLQNLQDAMLLLGDQSNRNVVKKAIKGVREQYGLGSDLNMRRLFAMFKRGSNENMYVEISTRMATIIAHQIDHISNLKEGQQADDMILKRNILDGMAEKEKEGKTMADRYGKLGGLSTLTGKYDDLLDAIAYAALTNNGTETLAGKSQEDLLNKLTPSQKKAIVSWREFINGNKDLVESAMIVRGNMKALIKNYFPRMLSSSQDVSSITDYDSYMNSQSENVGLNDGQISSRIGDKGKISLNGNKVLLNNLKALHLLNEMQPYVDQIKAVGEVVKELKTLASKEANEEKKREYNFAAAYAEGISITIKNRLDNSLLNGDKSLNNSYNFAAKAIGVTQKFAAKLWLVGTIRQVLSDYPANIIKTSAALASANKSAKRAPSLQAWRLLFPSKSAVRTEQGKFAWEDYVKIAEITGSPVYRTVSMYSDNFLYDYTKTPAELQREQKIMSWQDMAVKKQVWMERFENAFVKLTDEVFDHKAFEDERGTYRAMFYEAVQKASSAADSTVDRQFGLPSFARQPLRTNIFFPFIGRPLRYLINTYWPSKTANNILTISKTSWIGTITGFMQGYPAVQFSLFRNYMKLAFSGTSGLSTKERAGYMTQALTESFIPTFAYAMSRKFFGALFVGAAMAARNAAGDEDEEKKIMEDMDNQDWWNRMLTSFKLQFRETEDAVMDNLINSLTANVVDPNTTYLLRMAAGLVIFQYWKKEAIIAMDKREIETPTGKRMMTKEERKKMGKAIKEKENRIWDMFNVRPLEIYGGKDYEYALTKRDVSWAAGRQTQGWEELFESIGGFGEVAKTARSFVTIKELTESDNKNLDKKELLVASLMKAYALIFSNVMIGGKYGWAASMFTGDANKIANTILKDLENENREFLKSQKKRSSGGSSGSRGGRRRGGSGRGGGGRGGGVGRGG